MIIYLFCHFDESIGMHLTCLGKSTVTKKIKNESNKEKQLLRILDYQLQSIEILITNYRLLFLYKKKS